MIRIVKHGVSEFHATCQSCTCQFTYEEGDVHMNYLRGGEWVSCPSCGREHHHMSATRLPQRYYPNDYRVGRA